MLKIAIADDDKVLRSGIRKIIEENVEDSEIVVEASNGLNILKYLEENELDLILTDIKMPVVDGLALIKIISDKGYKTSVIVISGYSEYEILRETLKYGAKDYLLKPINKNELITLVEKIRSQKKAQNIMRNVSKGFLKEINENEYFRHESLIYNMVKNNTLYKNLIQYEMMEIKDVSWYLIGVLLPGHCVDEDTKRRMMTELQEKLRNEFCLYSFVDSSRLVVLFTFSCDNIDTVMCKTVEMIDILNESMKKSMGCGIRAACGSFVRSIKKIYSSYDAAVKAEEQLFYSKENCCFFHEDIIMTRVESEKTQADIQRACDFLKSGNEVAAKYMIRNLYDKLNERSVCVKDVRDVSLMIHSNITGTMRNRFQRHSNTMDIILSSNSINEVEKCILDEIGRAACIERPKSKPENKNVIEKACKYIDENFRRDINLKEVSQYVFLNATYFSELFKKESGINFIDYLIKTRIDEAKRILVNEPDVLINEVGRMVGYNEPGSFIRAFKKLAGCTPVCYRIMHRN